jgi:ERCC4-related helicase
MLQHFTKSDEKSTRAIVFVQYRESVTEIVNLLNRHQPKIKAASFIGQATGKSGV